MSKYFLDNTQLSQFSLLSKDLMIKEFLRFVLLAKTHELYKLYSSGDNLVTQVAGKDMVIGRSIFAKSSPQIQRYNELMSLNCGNYDSSLNNVNNESKYIDLRIKLLKYIESNNFSNLHLQDFSDDPNNFSTLEELGYTGIWIPNLIYSEGSLQNRNSGIGNYFKRDLRKTMVKMYVSLHCGNLPKVTNYIKNVKYNDLIIVNCSVYQVLIDNEQKTIEIFTNTYISPFSRSTDRLENILQTIKNIKQIKKNLLTDYPDYIMTEKFTGDMNIYGVNALHGPFGLKVSPWSFGSPLISSMLTGRNIPNERELDKLQQSLNKIGYKFVPCNERRNQTISIKVDKYAPSLLKKFFKNKKVGWQLDLCIFPLDQKITAKIDIEPFGSFDHATLRI
jgi:hypothetical protein